MKNLLEHKLNEIASNTQKTSEKIISDVNYLLENTVIEERETLRAIGLSHELDIADATTEDILIREKHRGFLGKNIVHISEINTLCLKYRLAMKKPSSYKGKIPSDLGSELRRFCADKNVPLSPSADHNDFYIIAPPSMFKDYQTLSAVMREEGIAAIERMKVRNSDPLLIYRIPHDKSYFAIIKGWGDDFSIRRRALGFLFNIKTLNIIDNILNLMSFFLPIILGIYTIKYSVKISDVSSDGGLEGPFLAIAIVSSIIMLILGWVYCFNETRNDFTRKLINRISTKKY